MTREQMLNQMGLTPEELKDFLLKLAQLRASLNDSQRAVFDLSLPTYSAASISFGADVTGEDLEKLLSDELHSGFVATAFVALPIKNP